MFKPMRNYLQENLPESARDQDTSSIASYDSKRYSDTPTEKITMTPITATTPTPTSVGATATKSVDLAAKDMALVKKQTDMEDEELAEEMSNSSGDDDDDSDVEIDVTWNEVFEACCVHSLAGWGTIFMGIVAIAFFLYFFMFALDLLSSSAKVLTGCKAGALFDDDANPVAALMVGILATAMVQSSSTTTSIVVSLVGSGINVQQGIYMIMGANIGTTVTNTLVALGQSGDGDMLERAFAGATVHDLFNVFTVAILLPVEIATGYLTAITRLCVRNAGVRVGEDTWEGPVNKYVSPLGERIIKANKDLIKDIARGKATCEDGGGYYPIVCEGSPSDTTCTTVGLITCSTHDGVCPVFFSAEASAKDDKVSGAAALIIAMIILFFCLLALIYVLQMMMVGLSTRVLYKATNVNGYLAILIGFGITVVVQSSSVVTSTLTPLVGVGVLQLEQMYPLTLGSNVGTTMTAIMAALVADNTDPLRVAMAHLFFNLTGILIFYPIPFMRKIPMECARQLGKLTRVWLGFPFIYILVVFFAMPLLFIGISAIFQQHTKGYTVMGSFLCVILLLILAYNVYWCKFRNGYNKCLFFMNERERRRVTMQQLPNNMEYLNAVVKGLVQHTGYENGNFAEHMSTLHLKDGGGLEGNEITIPFNKDIAEQYNDK